MLLSFRHGSCCEFDSQTGYSVSRAAAMTLRTVLLSLQALLAAAEPDDPQDAVVAKQYKENNEIFKKTARHWTYAYAGGHLNYLFILLCTGIFITF